MNGPQSVPDPAATRQAKKAGLVNISLTIVCQMQPGNAEAGGKAVYDKAATIVNSLLDEWDGVADAPVSISAAPPQQ